MAHFAFCHSERREESTHRLVERIRRRFPWTEEYYVWQQKRVRYRIQPLRPVCRIYEQRAQFESCLPGHILVVQMGTWWVLWGEYLANLPAGWERFPESELPTVKKMLWESAMPVACIRETGLRPTRISERELFCRWEEKKND